MVRDREPEKEGEFLEMEVTKAIDTSAPPAAQAGAVTGGNGEPEAHLTGPIADPPAPFEWSDWD